MLTQLHNIVTDMNDIRMSRADIMIFENCVDRAKTVKDIIAPRGFIYRNDKTMQPQGMLINRGTRFMITDPITITSAVVYIGLLSKLLC
jgi:hypothetical protein